MRQIIGRDIKWSWLKTCSIFHNKKESYYSILGNRERNGFSFFQKRKIHETCIHHLPVLANNFVIKRKIQGRIQENL